MVPHSRPVCLPQIRNQERKKASAALHGSSNMPFSETPPKVMFTERLTWEEPCSLPAANHAYGAPERGSLSALGPVANLTKCFLVFANRKAQFAAAAAGAGCQLPPGNAGICQVSRSAIEKCLATQSMWPEGWSRFVRSPLHCGKIMIALVFMEHYMTSAWARKLAFRGYERA